MPIYIEYYDSWMQQLSKEKQIELMAKIKKPNDATTRYERASTEEKFKKGEALIVSGARLRDDGTVWTSLKDRKEELRGYADSATVFEISNYKTLLPKLLSSFKKIGVFKSLITILAIKWNVEVISQYFHNLFTQKELLLKDEHWSAPTKEIIRVLLKHNIEKNIAYAMALIVEYDSAYRWRMQDIIVNLNKANLKGFKIVNEMGKLFDLLIAREIPDYDENGFKLSSMHKKFKNIKMFLQLGLILSSALRKLLRNILTDLDIDKVKFSTEDIYWVNQIGSYNYFGLSKIEREKLNIIKYGSIH